MKSIINNFVNLMQEDGFEEAEIVFEKSEQTKIEKLNALVGDNVNKVLEFYREYEPIELPMLPCYLRLINIDAIIDENTCGEPGMHLAKYGVFTIGVTVGGNVVCIDTNNANNGDPGVVLFDSNFCYYDAKKDIVRVGYIPGSAMHLFDLTDKSQITVLNYENIQKCGYKICDSFVEFLEKLSTNYYEDIEELLD